MALLMAVLVVTALLFGAAAIVSLSTATIGIGFIGIACLCAILARMAQASLHHDSLMKSLREKTSGGRIAEPATKPGSTTSSKSTRPVPWWS